MKQQDDDLFGNNAEDDDFDFENFVGIKEENLETNAMGGVSDDLMMRAIQIMSGQNPTIPPAPGN